MSAGTTVTPDQTPGQLTRIKASSTRLPPAEPPQPTTGAAANNERPTTVAEVVAIRSQYDNPVRLQMAKLAKEGKEQTIGGVTVTFSETGPGGKAPEGFVFASFKGKGTDGKPTEASVLIHQASGDLAKLTKDGETVSISASEQRAFNPFFRQMREGLKEPAAQGANQRAEQVSGGLQPVKEGKAPHLAELAKDVGAQGGSVTTGRVTVRSEGPSSDAPKDGGTAKPGAVPADHHRLTVELQPSAQAGSTPATPRVLSLLVDKTGKVTDPTIGGKPVNEQEVNAFLTDAQKAAKSVAPTIGQPQSGQRVVVITDEQWIARLGSDKFMKKDQSSTRPTGAIIESTGTNPVPEGPNRLSGNASRFLVVRPRGPNTPASVVFGFNDEGTLVGAMLGDAPVDVSKPENLKKLRAAYQTAYK